MPGRGRPIAVSTLVRIRATLLSGLKAAKRRGLIASNPAALVELPAHPRCFPVVWTADRVQAWLPELQRKAAAAIAALVLTAVMGAGPLP